MKSANVLLLENDTFLLDQYAVALEGTGVIVEKATTLHAAFDFLERRLFGVCVVDLMLNDPISHDTHDGKYLLQACEELAEGTLSIVVSAQERTDVAASLGKQYRPFRYIDKKHVGEDLGILTTAVREASTDFMSSLGTASESTMAELVGLRGDDSAVAASRLRQFAGGSGGPVATEKLLGFAVRGLQPLCPLRKPSSVGWTYETGIAKKVFWSKGLGHAVELSLSRNRISDAEGECYRYEGERLHAVAVPVALERDAFDGLTSSGLRSRTGGSHEPS